MDRDGGVPDPAAAGPTMIQIGTEGGFLPAPVVLPNTPVGYDYNRRNIMVLNVSNKTLFLGPAERADVIVDFSAVRRQDQLILYNDAPAPVPAFDPRYDYYTGDPDQTVNGRRTHDAAGLRPQHPDHHANPGVGGQRHPAAFNLDDAATQRCRPPSPRPSPRPSCHRPLTTPPTTRITPPMLTSRIQDTSLTFTPAVQPRR